MEEEIRENRARLRESGPRPDGNRKLSVWPPQLELLAFPLRSASW